MARALAQRLATAGRGGAVKERFPWCLPTRGSKGPGSETSATDVDPLQVFWGMPRRTRLVFEPNLEGLRCDLTGAVEPVVVRRYRSRPYGNNYKGWSKAHPLTPYYRVRASDTEWLARHPQPGRLAYKDWVGLVVADGPPGMALAAPAAIVEAARSRLLDARAGDGRAARIIAAGYDMDNMKPRGFVESAMPVVALGEEELQAAAAWPDGWCEVPRRRCASSPARVRQALCGFAVLHRQGRGASRPRTARARDGGAVLNELLARPVPNRRRERTSRPAAAASGVGFRAAQARAIFDAACPLEAEAPRGIGAVIAARRRLGLALAGYGRDGQDLFKALGLPSPAPGKKSAKDGKRGAT